MKAVYTVEIRPKKARRSFGLNSLGLPVSIHDTAKCKDIIEAAQLLYNYVSYDMPVQGSFDPVTNTSKLEFAVTIAKCYEY